MVRDTSLLAYYDVKRNLGERQQRVYDTIKTLGCPTNLEISRYLSLPINSVTPRTYELVDKDLVVFCEKRICSIGGRTSRSWRIAV